MTTLTTRQRDILIIILNEHGPISSGEMAVRLRLTPRQVNYSLQGVRIWLQQHGHVLESAAGDGFSLSMTAEQSRALIQALKGQGKVQIILSISQRQQLLALFLLTSDKPFILSQMEQLSQVSRVTVLKDIDRIEAWLAERQIMLVRKPNFGIQVSGRECQIQQALAEIIWGEASFSEDPIADITHAEGLIFNLKGDAKLLPLVDAAATLFAAIPLRRIIDLVTKAEDQLGGRFTDDAVLHLALVFGILAERVRCGYHFQVDDQQIDWLHSLATWPVAVDVARGLRNGSNRVFSPADIAGIAMQMMAAPRNEILPGELERNDGFAVLVKRLLETIGDAYQIPQMKHDRILEDGLWTGIVTAYYRHRFQLWFPLSLRGASLPERQSKENKVAQEVIRLVFEHNGVTFPQNEIDNLILLLHTAYIRNRSYRFERVIVVCPSGMATAQLLIARLKARFPYLNALEVVSLRELTPAMAAAADLTLTTVPLPRQFTDHPKVIQVHPLLMPEDVEKITQFLV